MARAINKVTVAVKINDDLEYEYSCTVESDEATYKLTERIQRAVLGELKENDNGE